MDAYTGWGFWVRRYGPAEAACLVTMLVASVLAAAVTTSPPVLAACAIIGATVGFYGVLGASVLREQRRAAAGPWRAALRTAGLLLAEFGVAEVLDTFFWRPALMIAAVVVLNHPVWGLLAGKLVADVLFYAVSALGFRATVAAGVRRPRVSRHGVSHM